MTMATTTTATHPAVLAYANWFTEYELDKQRQRNPERLAQLLAENPSAIDDFRNGWIETGNQLASDIVNRTEAFCKKVSYGAFHPSNKATRQLFEAITGISLSDGVETSRKQVHAYAGDVYAQWLSDRQREQDAKEEAAALAESAAKADRLIAIYAKISADTMIEGDQLVDACKALGVVLPIQTIGLIRRRVRTINSCSATISSGKSLSNSPYFAYRDCQKILAERV
jgi:hypothetical protein